MTFLSNWFTAVHIFTCILVYKKKHKSLKYWKRALSSRTKKLSIYANIFTKILMETNFHCHKNTVIKLLQ